MEVIVYLINLDDVFFLHVAPGFTLATGVDGLREADLVDHDVVDVDFELGELNGEALGLVEGEELGDHYCDESCLFRVSELLVYLYYLSFHGIQSFKDLFLHVFSAILATASEHREHTSELLLHLNHLQQRLIQYVREIQKSQCVPCRCSVEYYHIEVVLVEGP